MSTLATLSIRLIAETSALKKSLDDAAGMVEGIGKKLTGAGAGLTLSVTAPLTAAGGFFALQAQELNRAMANVGTLSVPIERLQELKPQLQNLSIDLAVDTGNTAAGLYEVISAFGDDAETLSRLTINAKAAAAGNASVAESVALTSAVTKGYGDTSATAMQQVADLAFKTVELGQTNFPQLAASMGRVVPLANELGIAQEELFAIFAAGTGVTGSTSEVSTQYRGVLQSLLAPTADMQKLMGALGYTSGEAMIEQLGFIDTVKTITSVAEAAGVPLQSFIGSIEGQTLALALSGPLADQYTAKLEKLTNAAGATDSAFDAQSQGVNRLGFMLQQAQIKFTVFGQKIGDAMGPALLAFAETLEPLGDKALSLATWFSELDETTQKWAVGIAAGVAAAGPLLVFLGMMASGMSTVLSVAGALAGALGLLATPVGLVAAAIAGLGLAFATDFGGVRTMANGVIAGLAADFSELSDEVEAVKSAAAGIWDDILAGDWAGARAGIGDLGKALGDLGKATWDKTQEVFNSIDWSQFIPAVEWDGIVGSITWGDFVGMVDLENKVASLQWGDFVAKLDLDAKVAMLAWGDFVAKIDWANSIAGVQWGDYLISLDWANWVATIKWGDYVASLSWEDIVEQLKDWGSFIKSLDWGAYILQAVDWATWIPALAWTSFVSFLELSAFVTSLIWGNFIAPLIWGDDGAGNAIIKALTWENFVNLLAWGTFIGVFAWDKFIEKLQWLGVINKMNNWATYISSVDWGSFVPNVNWASFIPRIEWPDWGALFRSWLGGSGAPVNPSTQPGAGTTLPGIKHVPGVTDPMPIDITPSGPATFPPGAFGGTHAGGPAVIGEIGPELAFFGGAWQLLGANGPQVVDLPAGTEILPADVTARMFGGGLGAGLTIPAFAQGTALAAPGLIFPAFAQGTGSDPAAPTTTNASGQTVLVSDIAGLFDRNMRQAAKNVEGAWSDAAEQAMGDLQGLLRSVPGLFGTSQVTGQQMDMAALGVPQNFADDYLRRLTDEVLNGVDWAGVDIGDAAQRAGIDPALPAEAILKMFSQAWADSSLFADGANLDLFNVDAVNAAIERQKASESGQQAILQYFGVVQQQATEAALTGVAQVVTSAQGALTTGLSSALSATPITVGQLTPPDNALQQMANGLMAQFGDPAAAEQFDAVGALLAERLYQSFAAAAKQQDWLRAVLDAAGAPAPTGEGAPAGATGAPVGSLAQGTDYWRGGWTWVGERRPELVNLPRGARVDPSHDRGAQGEGNVTVVIEKAEIKDERDAYRLGWTIQDTLARRRRGKA